MRKKPPMQPVVWDGRGVIRFQQNEIVRYLLDHGGLDLNKLRGLWHPAPKFRRSDWDQFNQLIGYSVSGCPLRSKRTIEKADERAVQLLEQCPNDPALESNSIGEEKER